MTRRKPASPPSPPAGSVVLDESEPAAEWVDVSRLHPWPQNPREHAASVPVVEASVKDVGWTEPIVARRSDGRVVAGHGRLKVALRLGIPRVPVRWVDMTDEQAAREAIRDNTTTELTEWDPAALDALADEFDLSDLHLPADLLSDHGESHADLGGIQRPRSTPPALTLVVSVAEADEIAAHLDRLGLPEESHGETLARILREAR